MTFQFRVMMHRSKIDPAIMSSPELEAYTKFHPDGYSYWTDIREVYYKDDAPSGQGSLGSEWVETYSDDPCSPMGGPQDDDKRGPLAGIVDDMAYYMLAMSLPILNEWELSGYLGD